LAKLEEYAKNIFSDKLATFLNGYEKMNVINQIRISTMEDYFSDYEPVEGQVDTRKELWVVEENNKSWNFICFTLYTLPISKGQPEFVTRSFELKFEEFWKIFGVNT